MYSYNHLLIYSHGVFIYSLFISNQFSVRGNGKMKIYIKIISYDKDKVVVSSFDGTKQWKVT